MPVPLPQFELEQPLVLVLLPPCLALVVLLWKTSRAYLPPLRRGLLLALRLVAVSLVVLALAEPMLQLRANDLAEAILVDRSDSINAATRDAEDQWLAQALAAKAPQDRVAVVDFAGDALVDRPLSADATPPTRATNDNLHPSRTNIAEAIRTGLAALPSDAARRLVLLSDGAENQDQATSAAALAQTAGVQLLSVPLAQDSGAEALVDALDAPAQVREGDRVNFDASIRSTVAQPSRLDLLVDDRLVSTQNVQLQAGSNRFVLPVDPLPPGEHVARVQLEASQDTLPENNTAGAYVVVVGAPRVLLIAGTPDDGSYLADALRATGLQVDQTDPHRTPIEPDVLNSYATVVLANVAASDLSSAAMDALKNYVQTFGGGLIVAGGDHAFGPGGYARTPLEDMLPVQMNLRGNSVSASTALVLVMDVSGSMGENIGGATKEDMAKQAATAAAELLGPYDQIGVLAFDDQNHWMIKPTFANDLGPIEAAINRMQPGGGTEIYPAVKEAYDSLVPIDAKVKHIVLLTDGDAPRGPYEQLAQQMDQAHITLSTIGIGSDADTALLQQLAQLGHGRYYDGNDPFQLPQLVIKETQQVQRAAIVEQDVQPVVVGNSPALAGLDMSHLPPLRGYVATTPKPQSSVLLAAPQQFDPILAQWQFGLGRVIAWTSDVTNRWSANWLSWPQGSQFWSQLVKSVARAPQDPNRQINVSVDGSQARITLDAQTGADSSSRQYLNFLPTTATLVDPHGTTQQLSLPQVAPGRYQTTAPVDESGVYRVEVSQTNADGSTASQSSGFVVPYSPEYRATGTDQALLDKLARATGGHLIHDPSEAFVHDLPSVDAPRPLAPYLLVLAAILLVLDVAVRRVRVSGVEVRRGYREVRRRLGYVDERPAHARRVPRSSGPALTPVAPLVSTPHPPPRPSGAPRGHPAVGAEAGRSGRLLAAKQRAQRR